MEKDARSEDYKGSEERHESNTVRDEQEANVNPEKQESGEIPQQQEGSGYLDGDNLRAWSPRFENDEQFERGFMGSEKKQETEDWF